MVLSSTVLDTASLTLGNLNLGGLVNTVVLVAALVTGAVAMVKDRERPWVAWLSTILPAVVLGFLVVEILTGNWD